MSFFSKLFGGKRAAASGQDAADPAATGELEYKGFIIRATPFKENGQFQTAGTIEKQIGGSRRVHKFVRADRSPSADEVTSLALNKGQLIVDQLGDTLFD